MTADEFIANTWIPTQKNKIKISIARKCAEELSKMEPCYFPTLERDYLELLKICNIDEKQLKKFADEFYPKRLALDRILKEPATTLSLLIAHYFLEAKDPVGASYAILLLSIRFYLNRMKKHFPTHCNPEIFKYALDRLSRTHLFARESTIANAIVFLTDVTFKKHIKELKEFKDPEALSKFVYELRHRVAQSIKSLANLYYTIQKAETPVYKTHSDNEDFALQHVERGSKQIDDVIQNITVYKTINKRIFAEAIEQSGIEHTQGEHILKCLDNSKYSDDIKTILAIFLSKIDDIKHLCNKKNFYEYYKKSITVKRSVDKYSFKQLCLSLMGKLESDPCYPKELKSKPLLKSKSLIFISLYITLYLKYISCGKYD